jgi:hypothetical protein
MRNNQLALIPEEPRCESKMWPDETDGLSRLKYKLTIQEGLITVTVFIVSPECTIV